MGYQEAFADIRADFQRYAKLINGGGTFKKIFEICVHERGFVYLFWFRLTKVKSPLKPLFWLIYHHLSSKYGIQISTRTPIGPGLYIGHGIGIVINASAKIGKNVTLSQFLSVGSNKGNAAIIDDNVYIGPSVCLVEDVNVGRGAIIGAGAVVTRDVPPMSVVVGVPAKVIKKFNFESQKWENV